MRSLLANPLLHQAVRRVRRKRLLPSWWPGRRLRHLLLTMAGAAAVGGMCALEGRQAHLASDSDPILWMVSAMLGFGIPWLVPALTAPAIARERVAGTLDLLRVTTLGEGGIVLGKAIAGLARMWPAILTLALVTFMQAGWDIWGQAALMARADEFGNIGPGGRLVWGVGGALLPWSHLVFNGAVGLFASVWIRSAGVAVAASYASLVVMRICVRMLVLVAASATLTIGGVAVARWPITEGWALPLMEAALEMAASVLLLRGAVWGLRRR